MAAPQVRELNSLITTLGKSVQPQKALIDADIAANATAGAAQEAGLQATQQKAFGAIEQGAQNKGMFFSGFSPDQQAEYTASTYLPALAQLQATIAQTRSNLLGKKADLDTDIFKTAFQTREGDIERKFNWETAAEDRNFQERMAREERKFTMEENAKDRAASAAQARQAAQQKDVSGVVNSVKAYLDPRRGKDKKVSPATFQEGRNIWVQAGGDPAAYAQAFVGYVNRSHESDYF